MAYTNGIEKQGIVFTFAGETASFDEKADGVKKALKALRNEYGYLKKDFQQSPDISKFNALLTNLKDKERLIRQELDAYKKDLEALPPGTPKNEQWVALEKKIVETEKSLQSVQKEISELTKKSAEINVLAQKFENTSKKLDDLGKKLNGIANQLKVVSAAAAGALVGIGKASIDFESSMASVKKTVDETDTIKYEDLADAFREMSLTIPSSAAGIAEVAAIAGQLGVKTENIEEFTRAVIDLSNSTDLSGEEAATNLAQIFNITGSDLNNVDRFASVLVELGNNSATTESRILEMATRLAAASRQVGLSDSNLLALSTTLSSVGLNAEAAGSSISTIIRSIDKAVATNSGSVEDWAKVVGMSTKKFSKLWKEDAYSAITKVIEALGNAKDSGGNLSVMLEKLNVKNIRQTDSMSRLANASQLLSSMTGMANEEWERNTALVEEASKRYETTESKIQILKNAITNVGIELGEALLPTIKKVVESITTWIKKFSEMDDNAKNLIVTLLMVVASLSPLFKLLNIITTSAGALSKGISILITTSFTPLMGVVAGVIALLIAVYVASEDFRESVKYCATEIWNFLVKSIESLITILSVFWNMAKPMLEKLGSTLAILINYLADIFKWINEKVMPIVEVLCYALGVTLGVAIDVAIAALDGLIKMIMSTVDWFVNLFEKIGNTIGRIKEFFSARKDFNDEVAALQSNIVVQKPNANKYQSQSGGYSSGGYTFNNAININTSRVITQADVQNWGKTLADSINMELGRRI